PKGVLQNHGNLLHYLRLYVDAFRMTPEDRVTTLFPFTVNGGLHDALLALVTGATLCPWNARELGFAGLPSWLVSQGTTIYSSVPTAFRQLLANSSGDERFAALRLIRLWGEPSYRRDFVTFQKVAPDHCALVNRLGASETGPVCWQFFDKHSTFEGNNLPVGYPTPSHEVLLVDEHGQTVPVGDPGEIVVRSRFLSPGYWRREEQTRAVFETELADPEVRRYHTGDMARLLPDGCLVPLGRRDHQIKIRGYRVEVDEIEQVLVAIDGIDDAVVIAQCEPEEEPRLVGYFVGSASPTVSALRRVLAARLPEYMIPAAFVRLDTFPLAPNGKIARRQLPPPGRQRPRLEAPYAPAATSTQQWLVSQWQHLLRLDQIGVDDPFLELGGDSLLATQIASRASERFQRQVPMRLLFEHSTIAALASAIEALEIHTTGHRAAGIPRASRTFSVTDTEAEPNR
ncbi:MAG: non-ribosomal peptide synthetase, partial [Vicinamibacterales bacterium]